MGGNWGTNFEPENTLPEGYFEYLRELNVNWVGISVALHYDDSMDSTVERVYSDVQTPTFTDDFLREMIRSYHQYGICVYLTLAFEAVEAEESDHPVIRYELGVPDLHNQTAQKEFWPWAIDHPDHERFVTEFWGSYTQQAVHFGQIAEEEGVSLYSLGTETEALFRTRPIDLWPNDFRTELQAMVDAVREVYHGSLTYDMHISVFDYPESFGLASYNLWEDLGLDVIGLSAYFPLVDSLPTRVMGVEELEESWEAIFQDYLIPLQAANLNRPIYFIEFGYSDSILSPYNPSADEFRRRIFSDIDGNGSDDGEEAQANIYEALYNVMDRHPGVVNGTFLWGMMMADTEQWAVSFAQMREFSVRDKLSEDVVRNFYGAEPRETKINKSIEIPTPVPTLSSDQIEADYLVYDDELAEGWTLDPWAGTANTSSSAQVYQGSRAIEITLRSRPGAILLDNKSFDTVPYDYMVFYLNGGTTADQELYVEMISVDNKTLGRAELADFIADYPLQPNQWHQVVIPLSVLNPDSENFGWFDLGDASGNGASTFYIDEIRFVSARP